MKTADFASDIVLIVSAILVVYIAVNDLRDFKIRNELVALLGAMFFIHAGLSGRWVFLYWNVSFAALMFAVTLCGFALRLVGGGDVKLMTVASLWCGLPCAALFALIFTVFAVFHALLARLGWVSAQRVNGQLKVALAPSIAAGLIGVFISGCLVAAGDAPRLSW
jgi:prepilin peptidase CpaA